MFGGSDTEITKGRILPELIPDTKFKQPSAWQTVGLGASIVNGQLRFINSSSIRVAPLPDNVPIIGDEYVFKLVIERFTFGMGCRCLFGGVNIWTQAQGPGVFRGTVVPTAATGLVFQALPGTYRAEYVSIQRLTR